jgi:hypothetical protein
LPAPPVSLVLSASIPVPCPRCGSCPTDAPCDDALSSAIVTFSVTERASASMYRLHCCWRLRPLTTRTCLCTYAFPLRRPAFLTASRRRWREQLPSDACMHQHRKDCSRRQKRLRLHTLERPCSYTKIPVVTFPMTPPARVQCHFPDPIAAPTPSTLLLNLVRTLCKQTLQAPTGSGEHHCVVKEWFLLNRSLFKMRPRLKQERARRSGEKLG